MNRKNFIKTLATGSLVATTPLSLFAGRANKKEPWHITDTLIGSFADDMEMKEINFYPYKYSVISLQFFKGKEAKEWFKLYYDDRNAGLSHFVKGFVHNPQFTSNKIKEIKYFNMYYEIKKEKTSEIFYSRILTKEEHNKITPPLIRYSYTY